MLLLSNLRVKDKMCYFKHAILAIIIIIIIFSIMSFFFNVGMKQTFKSNENMSGIFLS